MCRGTLVTLDSQVRDLQITEAHGSSGKPGRRLDRKGPWAKDPRGDISKTNKDHSFHSSLLLHGEPR